MPGRAACGNRISHAAPPHWGGAACHFGEGLDVFSVEECSRAGFAAALWAGKAGLSLRSSIEPASARGASPLPARPPWTVDFDPAAKDGRRDGGCVGNARRDVARQGAIRVLGERDCPSPRRRARRPASHCAHRCPCPGPSPLVPRGEGRIRSRGGRVLAREGGGAAINREGMQCDRGPSAFRGRAGSSPEWRGSQPFAIPDARPLRASGPRDRSGVRPDANAGGPAGCPSMGRVCRMTRIRPTRQAVAGRRDERCAAEDAENTRRGPPAAA